MFKDGSKKCDYNDGKTECTNFAIDKFGMDADSRIADLCGEHWQGYVAAVHTGKVPQPHLVCTKCGRKVQVNPVIFSQYMMLLDNRDHHRTPDPFYLCPNCYVISGSCWSSDSGRVVYKTYGDPAVKIVSKVDKVEVIT